jgi:hypothetical protein
MERYDFDQKGNRSFFEFGQKENVVILVENGYFFMHMAHILTNIGYCYYKNILIRCWFLSVSNHLFFEHFHRSLCLLLCFDWVSRHFF